ncbi:PAS/PAC sensor signal transduction histidine kinase [Calothrix sp. PCC 7716]|nr:PAS/PAC sensor signal transduction histidine kinase [Calothrix sp. PCC 7716]
MTIDHYKFIESNSKLFLQTEESNFAQILINRSIEAAFCLEANGKFTYVNDAICLKSGYSREELLSMTVDEIDIDFSPQLWSQLWQALKSHSLSFESRFRTKTGEIIKVEVTISYAEDKGQEFCCAFAREKNQAELELCQALKQAKLLSEHKERFVSMLCHQFRTPLNFASFSADLLKRHSHQWTEEKKCSYFGLIQLGIKQISELLDEILLFGKAEAAKLEYQPREMNLNLFCNEIISQVELANSNQISINFVSQNNSITADFDPKMLQLILTNLLSNAIKYSPENSSVMLELSCEDKNIVFKIQDTGIGIPEKDRERIFDPFYRGSNIDSIAGTGLGLSIVKTIVDLHGGEIFIESQVGVGTTFTVTLSPVWLN